VVSFLQLLSHNKSALIGTILFGAFVIMITIGPIVYTVNPFTVNTINKLAPPNLHNFFGTDLLGRDLFARSILGGEISLYISTVSVIFSLALGVPLGLIAGYTKGIVDEVIMRTMDILLAFPGLVLALLIVAVLGIGISNAIIAIGVTGIPIFARIVRGVVLKISEMDYVEAARALGFNRWRIMIRHVLPNVSSVIILQFTLSLAAAILTEAALSFLGLGAPAPLQSLGGIVEEGFPFLQNAWWYAVFPGILITIAVLGPNFLGDGLRDLLDPKLRGSS
jgi:peptide/nickel transport system permease protein